jgi:type IV pilus assembly protein PilM
MRSPRRPGRNDRVVGLEIGDDSVRAVEVAKGLIRSRVELALPEGAVRFGEVHDDAAVRSTIKRVWKLGKLSSKTVVFGLPTEHIVARQADLPDLPIEELRRALRFEVSGVIPFPIDESILDCTEIEREQPADGPGIARVLVVAAYQPAVRRWLDVLKSAKLTVAALDHWAYGFLRAAGPGLRGPNGSEILVDIGADSLGILIHAGGVPRFARSLEGFAASASVSLELEAEIARIERFRRRLEDDGSGNTLVEQYVQRDPIADAVRSTVDYLEFQPGQIHLDNIRLAGDLDRARPVVAQLSDMLHIPVSVVPQMMDDPHFQRLGDLIHPERDLICLGHALALSEITFGPGPLDLIPEQDKLAPKRRRDNVSTLAALTIGATAVGAVIVTGLPNLSEERAALTQSNELLAQTRAKVAFTNQANPDSRELIKSTAMMSTAIAGAVDWSELLADIVAAAPPDAPLRAIATVRPDAETPETLGSVTLTVQGASQNATASWLSALTNVDGLSNPWPGQTTSVDGGVSGNSQQTATVSATVNANAARTLPDHQIGAVAPAANQNGTTP